MSTVARIESNVRTLTVKVLAAAGVSTESGTVADPLTDDPDEPPTHPAVQTSHACIDVCIRLQAVWHDCAPAHLHWILQHHVEVVLVLFLCARPVRIETRLSVDRCVVPPWPNPSPPSPSDDPKSLLGGIPFARVEAYERTAHVETPREWEKTHHNRRYHCSRGSGGTKMTDERSLRRGVGRPPVVCFGS